MNKNNKTANTNKNMYKAILELHDIDEVEDFLNDICSMSELRSMEQRYNVAEMLYQDKVYTEIIKETGASSATVSRVKRVLFYGTGALKSAIERILGVQEEA